MRWRYNAQKEFVMNKPVNNLRVNVKSSDKVSFRTRDRFGSQAMPTGEAQAKPVPHVKKVVKYKTRKR